MSTKHVLSYAAAALFLAVAAWQLGSAGLIAGKAWLAPILIDRAWAETLEGDRQVRPWDWADTWPVAELRAPDQDIRRIVLANTSMRNLAFGPTMDRRGDIRVLFAHRDTHFRFLKDMAIGDRLLLTDVEGRERAYSVRNAEVLNKNDILLPENAVGQDALMLITCYPFDNWQPNGPLRYVVWAEPLNAASMGEDDADAAIRQEQRRRAAPGRV